MIFLLNNNTLILDHLRVDLFNIRPIDNQTSMLSFCDTNCEEFNDTCELTRNTIQINTQATTQLITVSAKSQTTSELPFKDQISNYLLRKYLKYKDKHLIPEYICDLIFKDIASILEFNNNHIVQFIDNLQTRYKTTDISIIPIITTHLKSHNTVTSILKTEFGKISIYN